MKLETYTKIFITSVLISLAFLANATGNLEGFGEKPMAAIPSFPSGETINDDNGTTFPFSGVDIEPVDPANLITVTISFTTDPSVTNKGTLTDGGFSYSDVNDNYTLSGTETEIENALSELKYTPSPNQVAAENSYNVFFDIEVAEDNEPSINNYDNAVTVTVNSINDAPVINNINSVSINEDDVYPLELEDIEFTDEDVNDNTTFTFLLGNGANYTIENGGTTIVPNQDFFGSITVPVSINDGIDDSETFDLEITVNPINDPPSFTNPPPPAISQQITEGEEFSWDVNAEDIDLDEVTYVLKVIKNPGQVDEIEITDLGDFWLGIDDETGELSGTPEDGDDATYQVFIVATDGELSTAEEDYTFGIIVNANNSNPFFSLSPPLSRTVNAGTSGVVEIIDVLTYTDNNNDPNQKINEVNLEVLSNSGNINLFSILTSTFDPNDLNFEPNEDAKNDLEINYTIRDGELGSATVRVTIIDSGNDSFSAEFTISVLADNNPPEVPDLPMYEVDEDVPEVITITNVTPGDGESNNQLINSVRVNSLSENIIQTDNINISFVRQGNGSYNITIEYTLEENTNGIANLQLIVEDNANRGETTTTKEFKVNVVPVDDAPFIIDQFGEERFIDEEVPFNINLGNLVYTHPSNEDEELTLNILESDNGDYIILNQNTGRVRPRTGFNGVLEVAVNISDEGTGIDRKVSNTFLFRVNVNSVNSPPTITGQTSDDLSTLDVVEPFTISEDNTFLLTIDQLRIDDDNPDEDLSIEEINAIGDNYTINNGNEITPKENFNGTITVQVIVTDGTNSSNEYNFIINVAEVNDPPIITGQTEINIDEEDEYEITIRNLFITDVDNTEEQLTLIVDEELEGVNYTKIGDNTILPDANFFGTLTIPVQVNDRSINSNVFDFEITVLPVNDAPTINDIADRQVPDDNGQTIFVNFSGVEAGPNENGQNLTITASSGNESLIQDVEVIYTPNQSVGLLRMETIPNREGRTTITVTVKDDGGTVNGGIDTKVVTFDVTVLGQNSAPTLDFISDVNLLEDFDPTPVRLRNIRDGDDGSQQITITATSSNPGLIPNPVINYVQGETEATLIYNPVAGQNGSTTITVTVKDNGGTENGGEDTYIVTFEISILGLNDRPTIDAVPDTSLLEDTNELVIILTGITDGDLDEVQKMAITATSSRPEIIPDPTVIYDSVSTTAELILNPMPNISGISTITITIKDDGGSIVAGQEDTRTITFQATVLPVNDQPTINPITDVIRFVEGDGTQRQLISGITDGDPELIQIITSVTVTTNKPEFYESLEVAYREGDTNGELIFMTDPDANGMDTLTITVTDNGGTDNGGINTVSTLVYVDIIPQNDPPTITNLPGIELPKNADPDCIALSGITDGDPELEQNITITAVSNRPDIIPDPEISEFKPNAGTATLCYEPLEDARGVVKITITVTDDGNVPASRSIELEINVGENNNPPEIRDENGDALEELNLTTSKDEPLAICFQVIDRDQDEVDLGQIISRNSDAGGEILPGSFTFKDDSLCFIYEAFPNTLSGVDWFEFTICDDVPDDIACDTIRLNIEILPSADLRIYDGISPKNSDGKNDAWFIEGIENYPNNVVQIYSTSGELVYEANGYDNRDTLWRGESNTGIVLGSRELPTGVYYYVIDLNGGSLPPQKGSVIIK